MIIETWGDPEIEHDPATGKFAVKEWRSFMIVNVATITVAQPSFYGEGSTIKIGDSPWFAIKYPFEMLQQAMRDVHKGDVR